MSEDNQRTPSMEQVYENATKEERRAALEACGLALLQSVGDDTDD